MSTLLQPDRRIRLMKAIERVLQLAFPEDFAAPGRSARMDLQRIDDHLDALVDIVRRSTARQIEPYIWQVLEDVCDRCPMQNSSCHCPLRLSSVCALYRSIPAIVETIAGELVAVKDEEYLRTHPQWLLNHQPFWSHR